MPRLRTLRFFSVNDAVARQVRGFSSGVFYAEGEEFTVSEKTWEDVQSTYSGYFERLPEPPKPVAIEYKREKYDPTQTGAMTLSHLIESLSQILKQRGDVPVFFDDCDYGPVAVKTVEVSEADEYIISDSVVIGN